jgi:peptide/nickel transport system permease protein
MKYALRRLSFYLIAAWASITLNFFLPRAMPGDAATALFARFRGNLAPEAMDALKQAFGLTEGPLYVQYWMYLKHLFQGDLGVSLVHFPEPVSSVVASGLLWSMFLAGAAVTLSFVVGTGLGAIAGWKRGGNFDRILPPFLIFLGAFPYFWIAMLALYIFGFLLDWFPLAHAYDATLNPEFSFPFIWSVIEHAFLPASVIVLATLGMWTLGMRNTMILTLGEDYMMLAQAKGLRPQRVLWKYAARNAILPNITGFGMALGFVVSGSLLTEIIFSYPGQGFLLLQAVRAQDYPLMQGVFLTITIAVLAANWFVDLVTLWLDPRTRSAT